jgi:hypothetical protein
VLPKATLIFPNERQNMRCLVPARDGNHKIAAQRNRSPCVSFQKPYGAKKPVDVVY